MSSLLERVDQLNEQRNFDESRRLLEDAVRQSKDPEIVWRLARCYYMLVHGVQQKPSKTQIKELMSAAKAYNEEAMRQNRKNANLLTWQGIVLEQIAGLTGTDERIKQSFVIRELWDEAEKLDPNNNVTQSCIGIWCYTVTDLPDIKRKLAKTFMTEPPNSCYEEALEHLLRSEQIAPRKIVNCVLHVAKTYYRLKQKDKAREYCEYVLQFPDQGNQIAAAKEEVKDLLKKL